MKVTKPFVFLLACMTILLAGCSKDENSANVGVTDVTLNKPSTTLLVGGAETLIATIAPEDATNKNVRWKSSDENVATVDANGKVTALAAGQTVITVTTVDGGKTATCTVTVTTEPIAVTGVELNRTETGILLGESETLVATITPDNATDQRVMWSSDNEDVATVDDEGTVTAVSEGKATITVTTVDGEKTATCIVTATKDPIAVTGVSLNRDELPLFAGDTEPLTATITPANATNKKVTWSSSNEDVATVDEDGRVTALADGKAVITVTTDDGAHTATCNVTVTTPTSAVTGVTLDRDELPLVVGGTEILVATVTPDDAADKSVIWSSDKESVATVDQNGLVTAVAAGEAMIIVTTVDGAFTATCDVTVTAGTISVTGVSLNTNELPLFIDDTAPLTATITPDNATDKSVIWSSSDESVATVDPDGLVTALAEGTATITVTTVDGEFTDNCAVTVAPLSVTGVALDKETMSLEVAEAGTLTATVTPEKAEDKSVTWSSSDENVATVDQNGKVTAVANGTTTITVTTTDGGHTATCEVTVLFNVLSAITDNTFSSYAKNRMNTSQGSYPKWDTNGDGKLSVEEAAAVTYISIDFGLNGLKVKEFTGLEYFTGLKTLYCASNQLTSLDLSHQPQLSILRCKENRLTSLDLSQNPQLTNLDCDGNQLTTLDLSQNPQLTNLACRTNNLSTLDVSQNTKLVDLYCHNNNLTELDVSNNPLIKDLVCSSNFLTKLDVSNFTQLGTLYCNDNELTELVMGNSRLLYLYCENNQLTSLDISGCTRMTNLRCYNNRLSTLDATNIPDTSSSFSVLCGKQTTDGTNSQTLTLTLLEQHRTRWESSYKDLENNENVTVVYQ